MSKAIKKKIREMVYLVMELNEKGSTLRICIDENSLYIVNEYEYINRGKFSFIYTKGKLSKNAESEIDETVKMLKGMLKDGVC